MLLHKRILNWFPPATPCMLLSLLLVLLPGVTHLSQGSASHEDAGSSPQNCSSGNNCSEGVVLPMWNPQNPAVGDKVARAIVYFAALIYMFLGMSIIADRFMSSIEVITSQEKEITIKKPNGETTTTTVRIWNETVSNLTLMALGSSAPEILLSVIEVIGHNFESGSLGPSTIVGSAAFNMFIIIAICVYVVPENETRKIKHLRVFFVTAAWSVFAYIWLYLILSVFSPGEVEVWEAVLTFLFFPLCVLQAWIADRRLLFYKYVNKRYRADKTRGIIIESEGDAMFTKMDLEMDGQGVNSHTHPKEALDGMLEGVEEGGGSAEQDQEEEARREMARTLKELKQRHPEKDMEQLIEMANYQVLVQQQKSRAFYRIQATRMMIGAGNILKKHAADQARKVVSCHEASGQEEDPNTIYLQFDPSHYQCFENCGSLKLSVSRHGGESGCTVKVRATVMIVILQMLKVNLKSTKILIIQHFIPTPVTEFLIIFLSLSVPHRWTIAQRMGPPMQAQTMSLLRALWSSSLVRQQKNSQSALSMMTFLKRMSTSTCALVTHVSCTELRSPSWSQAPSPPATARSASPPMFLQKQPWATLTLPLLPSTTMTMLAFSRLRVTP